MSGWWLSFGVCHWQDGPQRQRQRQQEGTQANRPGVVVGRRIRSMDGCNNNRWRFPWLLLSFLLLLWHQFSTVVDGFLITTTTTKTTTTTATSWFLSSQRQRQPFHHTKKKDRIQTLTATTTTTTTTVAVESSTSTTNLQKSQTNNNEYTNTNSNTKNDQLWQDMLHRFQGDFDNYHQVLDDRRAGYVTAREGGGHEHIHCTLIPVTDHTRLAAFYFDGQPQAIFRFRYYVLQPVPNATAVDTFLYTLHPELERQLRQAALHPLEWPAIFEQFTVHNDNNTSDNDNDNDNNNNNNNKVELLKNCQVRWSYELDPQQHSYVPQPQGNHNNKNKGAQGNNSNEDNDVDDRGIHAVMVHGEALVESQMRPGTQILIRDQLSLWNNELWIHDRGLDPHTLAFIYGNQRGVPYRLQRVSNIITTTNNNHNKNNNTNNNSDDDDDDRTIPRPTMRLLVAPQPRTTSTATEEKNESSSATVTKNHPNHHHQEEQQQQQQQQQQQHDDLAWTLGPEYRTEALYHEKIQAMGGPSIPPHNNNNKNKKNLAATPTSTASNSKKSS